MKTQHSIFTRIERLNLPYGQYAVFGSSLLDAWGLRRAEDLDIIATPELYTQLKATGWQEQQKNGFTLLHKYDANISTTQKPFPGSSYNPDRMQLIKEATIINGLPFVKVEEVIACKVDYGRPKDLADIELLKSYLSSHPRP